MNEVIHICIHMYSYIYIDYIYIYISVTLIWGITTGTPNCICIHIEREKLKNKCNPSIAETRIFRVTLSGNLYNC